MTLNKKPALDSRELFLAISDLIQNDDNYVNETLTKQGFDPDQLESEGNAFLKKLLVRNQIAEKSIKKTALIEKLTLHALQFLQDSTNIISSSLLPDNQGSKQQVYSMLCNKFKEFSPDDIKSIMHDEAILKELAKISSGIDDNEKRS
jgi:hypothetical protein